MLGFNISIGYTQLKLVGKELECVRLSQFAHDILVGEGAGEPLRVLLLEGLQPFQLDKPFM